MISLRLSGLTHEFDEREVFRSIDFEFEGGCLAVSGPNGSGKSTLLRILAGLLTPACGEAAFSVDGAYVPREALRSMVGLAAPDVCLYPDLTPRENLAFLLRTRSAGALAGRVDEALAEVGLSHRADDLAGELSSGLRRRACLAAALVHEPLILLLDEPSSNLDDEGVAMLRLVVERQAQRGMVVLATNDPAEAMLAAARLELR